jgi:hypothetical protein
MNIDPNSEYHSDRRSVLEHDPEPVKKSISDEEQTNMKRNLMNTDVSARCSCSSEKEVK